MAIKRLSDRGGHSAVFISYGIDEEVTLSLRPTTNSVFNIKKVILRPIHFLILEKEHEFCLFIDSVDKGKTLLTFCIEGWLTRDELVSSLPHAIFVGGGPLTKQVHLTFVIEKAIIQKKLGTGKWPRNIPISFVIDGFSFNLDTRLFLGKLLCKRKRCKSE